MKINYKNFCEQARPVFDFIDEFSVLMTMTSIFFFFLMFHYILIKSQIIMQ